MSKQTSLEKLETNGNWKIWQRFPLPHHSAVDPGRRLLFLWFRASSSLPAAPVVEMSPKLLCLAFISQFPAKDTWISRASIHLTMLTNQITATWPWARSQTISHVVIVQYYVETTYSKSHPRCHAEVPFPASPQVCSYATACSKLPME